jgi:hypothetical protein
MRYLAIAISLLSCIIVSADAGPTMKCVVKVPKEYRESDLNPPNGESEAVRYATAYQAFWWNCVAVRAADLQGRCPFVASGTPGASAGAMDGAANAETQIRRLQRKYGTLAVHKYLSTIAAQPEAMQKMRPYFQKLTPEAAN